MLWPGSTAIEAPSGTVIAPPVRVSPVCVVERKVMLAPPRCVSVAVCGFSRNNGGSHELIAVSGSVPDRAVRLSPVISSTGMTGASWVPAETSKPLPAFTT